jgi:hypothetical protein
MPQAYPISLSSLSEREAIADAVYRAAIGCDQHDTELFNSAWAGDDVTMELHDDKIRVLPNLSMIRTHVLDKVGPMDTTHSISMIRVHVEEGADSATLTATSMAQHCPPGTGREPAGSKYTVGGQYSVDLLKDGAGAWKIKKLVLNVIWTQGDASVMGGPPK